MVANVVKVNGGWVLYLLGSSRSSTSGSTNKALANAQLESANHPTTYGNRPSAIRGGTQAHLEFDWLLLLPRGRHGTQEMCKALPKWQ
jgi:hypothetical protein